MARRRYIAWSGATGSLASTALVPSVILPTTLGTGGTPASATSGTVLQLLPTTNIAIIEWGYQLIVVPTAATYVELLSTGTIAATVTAHVAADVPQYDDPSAPAASLTLSTSGSGYNASAEGTFSASTVRVLDQGPAWSQFYCKQFPLDREPGVIGTNVLRIRATSATSTNIKAYVIFES